MKKFTLFLALYVVSNFASEARVNKLLQDVKVHALICAADKPKGDINIFENIDDLDQIKHYFNAHYYNALASRFDHIAPFALTNGNNKEDLTIIAEYFINPEILATLPHLCQNKLKEVLSNHAIQKFIYDEEDDIIEITDSQGDICISGISLLPQLIEDEVHAAIIAECEEREEKYNDMGLDVAIKYPKNKTGIWQPKYDGDETIESLIQKKRESLKKKMRHTYN